LEKTVFKTPKNQEEEMFEVILNQAWHGLTIVSPYFYLVFAICTILWSVGPAHVKRPARIVIKASLVVAAIYMVAVIPLVVFGFLPLWGKPLAVIGVVMCFVSIIASLMRLSKQAFAWAVR
jgi:hypothetical protein